MHTHKNKKQHIHSPKESLSPKANLKLPIFYRWYDYSTTVSPVLMSFRHVTVTSVMLINHHHIVTVIHFAIITDEQTENIGKTHLYMMELKFVGKQSKILHDVSVINARTQR